LAAGDRHRVGRAWSAMSHDQVPIVTWVKFKEAFREPGCPLCSLRQEVLDWYFSRWVWDYISDPDMRNRMRRSLGLCPEHTWQLYRTDIREYDDVLGVSIVYQELVPHIAGVLHDVAIKAEERKSQGLPWQERLWLFLRRRSALRRWFKPASWRAGDILRADRCHVCAYNEEGERRDLYWLVQILEGGTYRTLYAASDGLCLPHLRRALELAMQINPDAAQFLAETAGRKMATLAADLEGYIRKRAYDRRHEAMTDGQQNAPRRASEFFGGLDGWNERRRRIDSI